MTDTPNSFFDLAPEGRRGAWRYLGGALLTLVLFTVLTAVLLAVLYVPILRPVAGLIDGKTNWIDLSPDQDFYAVIACIIILLSVSALLVATLIVARLLHRQPLLSLFTARPAFDMRRFFLSGLTMLLIEGAVLAASYQMDPESYQVVFDMGRIWPFAVVVILLTPFQALAEEVFFRGYLTQGVSAVTGVLGLRLIVPAIIFTIAHSANGDWSAGGLWAVLTYLTLALYLAFLALKSNGLEASAGLHAFHNMFAFLIVTSTASGMPFATVFVTSAEQSNYMVSYFSVLPILAIHYAIVGKLGLLKP